MYVQFDAFEMYIVWRSHSMKCIFEAMEININTVYSSLAEASYYGFGVLFSNLHVLYRIHKLFILLTLNVALTDELDEIQFHY